MSEAQKRYNDYKRTLIQEDAAQKYFEAICKSIEDPSFANELLSISSSLNLATFGSDLKLIKCCDRYHPGTLKASGAQIEQQIYSNLNRFYYKIKQGPFASYIVRPTYTSLGLFAGGYTHFTVEQESTWWNCWC